MKLQLRATTASALSQAAYAAAINPALTPEQRQAAATAAARAYQQESRS